MKHTNLSMLALSFILCSQSLLSAQAAVNVSREDKSPTAVQNSGATYDENDTTHARKVLPSQRAVNLSANRSIGDARTVTDTRASTVNSNSADMRPNGMAMNAIPPQEQQQVTETHSAAPWLLLLFAAIVASAIFYMYKRRDQPANRY